MENKAVPEGNCPAPQQEEFGSGEPTLADICRLFEEQFDRRDRKLDEMAKSWRSIDQRLAGLGPDARQPRLTMVADGKANTRELTEGTSTAVQVMHEDSCYADRVDPDPICSTSFGDDRTGPSAPACSGLNILLDNGAAAPNSCLPSLEMRSPTAAGGLLPTGEVSITTRTISNQLPLWLYSTEETNSKTLTSYVSYDSRFFQRNNLLAAPSCARVIETKSEENRMFDRLHACPFL